MLKKYTIVKYMHKCAQFSRFEYFNITKKFEKTVRTLSFNFNANSVEQAACTARMIETLKTYLQRLREVDDECHIPRDYFSRGPRPPKVFTKNKYT